MKELETTQELIMLREAIELSYKQGNNFLCEPSDIDALRVCSQTIADAAMEIDMLLTVDEQGESARNDAQKMMHLVLFHKTLSTCGEEDDTLAQYYEHVLTPFADIGWPVYVECIQRCDWHQFAIESWSSSIPPTQSKISQHVLRSMTILNAPKTFQIWQWSLQIATNLIVEGSGVAGLSNIVESSIRMVARTDNSVVRTLVVRYLVDTVKVYAAALLARGTTDTADVITLLCMTECLLLMVSTADLTSLVSSFDGSWFKCLADIDTMTCVPLKETANLLRKRTVFDESQDDRLLRAIRAMNVVATCESTDVPDNETVQVLLDELENSCSPNILECLLSSSSRLNPAHTFRLVRTLADATDSDAPVIKEIVYRAFSCWPIAMQDEFRRDCHNLRRQFDGSLMDDDFNRNLTETMNKMSLNIANEVSKDFSLLCLKSPVITINALIVYATDCGQAFCIAEILSHLKSSCSFEPQGRTGVLVLCLKKSLEESVEDNQVANIISLLRELIVVEMLPLKVFLSECVLVHEFSSRLFITALKIIQIILSTASDDVITNSIRPVALVAVVANYLHSCMVVDLSSSSVDRNVHAVKKEATRILKLLLFKILNKTIALNVDEVHWLWKKQRTFHEIVFFYFHPLFLKYGLEKRSIRYKEFSLDTVLVVLSLAKINREIDAEFLTGGWPRVIPNLVYSLSRILLRLTAEEISNLLFNLSKCVALCLTMDDKSHAKAEDVEQKSKIISVIFILNSLIRLGSSGFGNHNEAHLNRTVHFCGTTIRKVIIREPHPSISDLTLLTFVTNHLTERLPPGAGSVSKLLTLDVLSQMSTLKNNDSDEDLTFASVNALKDLVVESSAVEELDVHITKLIKRFCSE